MGSARKGKECAKEGETSPQRPVLLKADPGDHMEIENDNTSHQLSMCQVPGTLSPTLNSFSESS